MKDLLIKVGGMSCQGCVKGVTGALAAIDGVSQVEVSLDAAEARVRFDEGKVEAGQLLAAVEAAGFEAS